MAQNKMEPYLNSYNHFKYILHVHMLCVLQVCLCVGVCYFMLHLLECYLSPLALICPVREQQHGSLTCHIVAQHCLMIRECWRHSAVSGVISCCGATAIHPQICLGPRPRMSSPASFCLSTLSLFLPHPVSIWVVWSCILPCRTLSSHSLKTCMWMVNWRLWIAPWWVWEGVACVPCSGELSRTYPRPSPHVCCERLQQTPVRLWEYRVDKIMDAWMNLHCKLERTESWICGC